MDSYLYKLTSEKWRIGSLLVCMTITMLLAVFDKSVAYQMRWLGLCFICLFGLLLEWKTMLIGTDCVCIRYYPLGFKRIIPNERIFAAEIVSQNHQYNSIHDASSWDGIDWIYFIIVCAKIKVINKIFTIMDRKPINSKSIKLNRRIIPNSKRDFYSENYNQITQNSTKGDTDSLENSKKP